MSKYKNKDGIELNFGGMTKEGRDGGGVTLVQEVASKAVKMCDKYNMWDLHSSRMALDNVKKFLIENFDLGDKNDR